MFNSLIESIKQFFSNLRPWVIILPWQHGLRTRLGKYITVLAPGVHLRIPWLDLIFIQTIRTRVSTLGRQTVTTKDGKAITFCGAIGYSINDIEKLYCTLHHAEDTIMNMAKTAIGEFVWKNNLENITPDRLQIEVTKSFNLANVGINVENIYLTDFACVKTFRLIGDAGDYGRGDYLSTINPVEFRNTPGPS